jgi:hypothetical protein
MKRSGHRKDAIRLEARARAIRDKSPETLRASTLVDVRDLQAAVHQRN